MPRKTPRGTAGGTGLISVHADDGAMEAWCLIRQEVFPRPLHLVTVMSRSNHVAQASATRLPRHSVSAVRRAEDRRFGRACGLFPHNLGFSDRAPRSCRRHSALVERICGRLVRIVRRLQCSLLVSPFPHGENVHPHHLAVFRAAELAVTVLAGVELVLVDDVPYSRIPFGEKVVLNGTEYVPLVLHLSRDDLAAKTRLIRRCYGSQMCPRYFRALSRPAPGDRQASAGESLRVPAHLRAAFADRLRDPERSPADEGVAV